MSHFTQVKTQVKDLSLLDKAAETLGLKKVNRTVVNGYVGQKTNAEHVWQVSEKYDVGAVKSADGTYSLIADWWGTSQTHQGLDKKLIQEYGIQTVLRRAKLMGHSVTRESQKDGSVRLVVKTN
jgi:hypothetical protein